VGAPEDGPLEVKAAAAALREIPDEINGFGSLSFQKKVDVFTSQDGLLADFPWKEGDRIRAGDVAARVENPRVALARGMAENSYAQAEAALDLARSRLLEGEFQAEAQILSLEKSRREYAQACREYAESERKWRDQEALYEAGGVTEEAMRQGRFDMAEKAESLALQAESLKIQSIGLREEDLIRAGFTVPEDPDERVRAFVRLSTSTLRSEAASAEAALDAAAKELEAARLSEAELVIRSPITGIVGARVKEEGERIQKDEKFLTLMDSGDLYAVFSLRESEALRLAPGMEASVRIDGLGKIYAAKVENVSPVADNQSFTFQVKVILGGEMEVGSRESGIGNREEKTGSRESGVGSREEKTGSREAGGERLSGPKPGMFARVTVKAGSPRRAVVIPETALGYKRNAEAQVFVVQGSAASRRTVTLGASLGDDREITAGLDDGEIVVLKPGSELKEGSNVALVQ
jgi:multidrug efflux pump subunit AcrA (membrane-fusion protein)